MNYQKKQKLSLIDRMGGKGQVIAQLAFVILAIAAVLVADGIMSEQERKARWEASIPMANQHIEWSYARGTGK